MKLHPHTQSLDYQKITAVSFLFFIFMLAASFQAKSHCDMDVNFVTCSGTQYNFTVPQNTQHSETLVGGDIPGYVKINFPGGSNPDIVRYYLGCTAGPDETNPNDCYGNVEGITDPVSNTYFIDVW